MKSKRLREVISSSVPTWRSPARSPPRRLEPSLREETWGAEDGVLGTRAENWDGRS